MQKLMALAMMFKAKLALLLQLISTHLQIKLFVIAVISFIMNATKFWIDLKKNHQPSKVIYYEHAQHQHHYDHEDDHHGGYWGRSSNDSPQDIVYSSYVPQEWFIDDDDEERTINEADSKKNESIILSFISILQ